MANIRVLILGGTSEARALAAGALRQAGFRRSAVARRPHRETVQTACSGSHWRFRRRGRPRIISARRQISPSCRRDTPLRHSHLRQRRRGCTPFRHSRLCSAPAGMGSAAGRQLDRDQQHSRRRSPRSALPLAASFWRRDARKRIARKRRRSTSISFAASTRSTRRSISRMSSTFSSAVPSHLDSEIALLRQSRHRCDRRQE